MKEEIWRERAESRTDMTIGLIHLTKADTDEDAFDILWKILVEKRIIGGHGFVAGDDVVCCFQEVPPISIAENLKYEGKIPNNRVRYSPFGIRIIKGNLFNEGGRPVIYDVSEELKEILPQNEYWRIVDLDFQNSEYIIDWTHEREWRIKGDYLFDYEEIQVLLKNTKYYRKFIERCIKEDKLEMLHSIGGIITINSICC